MPSEQEARWPFYQGERVVDDEVLVKELRTHEDRLYLNDESFVLTNQTLIVDEWGRRLLLADIPVGSVLAVRYRTGPPSEVRGHGPRARVLVRIQVVEWPKRKIPAR